MGCFGRRGHEMHFYHVVVRVLPAKDLRMIQCTPVGGVFCVQCAYGSCDIVNLHYSTDSPEFHQSL